ncbi:MAG: CPBP family intramembrane glutamic endopeptidase [Bacteroidota bacterium]
MHHILQYLPQDKRNPRAWIGLAILLSYFLVYTILNVLSSSLVDLDEQAILNQDPESLLIMQGVSQILIFIVLALLLTYLLLRYDVKLFFARLSGTEVALTFLVSAGAIVVISALGSWNMELDFGDGSFAAFSRKMEDQLKIVTEHITDFRSTKHFLIALIAVAVIPAVSEELLFRGLLQPLLSQVIRNHHVAIWLTGILFSAIHLQFYGFFPRMLLGVAFGYLYYWSGKLSLAMLAHFFNNAFALILLAMAQAEVIPLEVDDMNQSAPWPIVLVCTILVAFLLVRFKRLYPNEA